MLFSPFFFKHIHGVEKMDSSIEVQGLHDAHGDAVEPASFQRREVSA